MHPTSWRVGSPKELGLFFEQASQIGPVLDPFERGGSLLQAGRLRRHWRSAVTFSRYHSTVVAIPSRSPI